ncbi:hypothetical protein LXL04_022029 [Taraxacum kok-saghyz]
MRKSVSMNDLSQYVQVQPDAHDSSNNSANLDGSTTIAADNGYASADDAVRNQSNGGRERKRESAEVKSQKLNYLSELLKSRPANVPEGAYVQWEIELLGFEMQKDWTGMDFRAIMNDVEKTKRTGELFKEGMEWNGMTDSITVKKGKAIANAYNSPDEDFALQNLALQINVAVPCYSGSSGCSLTFNHFSDILGILRGLESSTGGNLDICLKLIDEIGCFKTSRLAFFASSTSGSKP